MSRLERAADRWSAEQLGAVETQVQRLARSSILAQSPRQQRLLRHVVAATLAGAPERLKGYTLGVEVFDRPVDFDPNIDAVVRVEVGRLRGKLADYYSSAGSADPVLIELPKGGNAVRITFRTAPAAERTPESAAAPGTPAPAERPSIAVLPFANLSADPQQDYFADGITEDLITDLSKLSGLSVVSRHSSFVYRRANRRIEEIGAELGVRYLLEGSVRRAGDTLRIAAQLVDARGGGHLWAERYDRPLRDVFAVQDEVTHSIVSALAVTLTPLEEARIGHEGTASLEAYDTLLLGLERFWLYTPQTNVEAQSHFRRALALDPEYAAAHAWLARSLVLDYVNRWAHSSEVTLEEARRQAAQAVALDGLLAYAHAVRCWAELWGRNAEEALRAGRRAVALDPNSADARVFLSACLAALGRGEEALRQVEIGMRLNPHPSAFLFFARGQALVVLGRYAQALPDFEEGIRLRSAFPPNYLLAAYVCVQLGRLEEGRRYAAEALALAGDARRGLRPITLASWGTRMSETLRTIGVELG